MLNERRAWTSLLSPQKSPHSVERAWEVLDPVLSRPARLVTYAPGSWGPEEADDLIGPRRWHLSRQTPGRG